MKANLNKKSFPGLSRAITAAIILLFFQACKWGIQPPDKHATDAFDIDLVTETDMHVEPPADIDARDEGVHDLDVETEAEVEAGCTTGAQCDDGKTCNGEETCTAGGTCLDGADLPDGTTCRAPTGRDGTCTAGVCVPDDCGNEEIDLPEECDDGNDVPADGCEKNCTFTCHTGADCDDLDGCKTDQCVPGANGQICIHVDNTEPCNDGLFCTAVDRCDGGGTCAGSGDTCADALDCTENERCDEDADGCAYDIAGGTCLIGGACFDEGDADPANECQECHGGASHTDWSPKDDGEACAGGLCCVGACRAAAECCRNEDCPGTTCFGTAAACDTMTDEPSCSSQSGCTWLTTGDGECSGTHLGCSTYLSQADCAGESGCSWGMGACVGYTCQ